MVAHLHGKVHKILKRVTLPDNPLIIDIGANDGTTFQAYPQNVCILVGVDPTGQVQNLLANAHPTDSFSAATVRRQCGSRKATVITSFSMFDAVREPLNFMKEVADVLSHYGIWMLEQSYIPTMLLMN